LDATKIMLFSLKMIIFVTNRDHSVPPAD